MVGGRLQYKSTRFTCEIPMYEDHEFDYEIQYEMNNESYTHDLDEMCEYHMRDTHNHHNHYEIDDEYARDTQDIQELAYKHYAW